jgi:hypothetical protein
LSALAEETRMPDVGHAGLATMGLDAAEAGDLEPDANGPGEEADAGLL